MWNGVAPHFRYLFNFYVSVGLISIVVQYIKPSGSINKKYFKIPL